MTTRMRYFELPTEYDGDNATTPFVIVFDRCPEPQEFTEHIKPIKELTGARAVLAFGQEIEFE